MTATSLKNNRLLQLTINQSTNNQPRTHRLASLRFALSNFYICFIWCLQIQALHLDTVEDKNLRQHIRYILKNEGFSGFYRGLSIELMKVVPMVGVMFGTYEFLRGQLSIN